MISAKEAAMNVKVVAIFLLVFFISFGVVAPDKSEQASSGLGAVSILLLIAFLATAAWLFVLVVYKAISKTTSAVKSTVNRVSSERELKSKIIEALSDGVITDAEEADIKRLSAELGLDDGRLSELRRDFLNKDAARVIKRIRESKRFSPQDEKELVDISAAHKLTAVFKDDLFNKYRVLWEIETSGTFIPKPISANIRLANGEQCYFAAPATWKQEKRIRERTGYVGGSVGFRVAKGVSLRVGRAVPTYNEYDDIVTQSEGILYVTSKKMVFVGSKKSTNITFGRLANYQLFRNAIQVSKTSGSPDIFELEEDDVMILDALLQVV